MTAPTSTGISATGATLGGNVTSDGGTALTEIGLVYSESSVNADPLIGGTGVSQILNPVLGTGIFSLSAANLSPSTAYVFRAYASSAANTAYTGATPFTTTANHSPGLMLDNQPVTFQDIGSLLIPRSLHTATLLPDGKVVVDGTGTSGSTENTAELYNPGGGTWSATGSPGVVRRRHTATLLTNGKVLVAGGTSLIGPNGSTTFNSTEVYDPPMGTWTASGNMGTARYFHTATLLTNGKVLVAGGNGSNNNPLGSAELYDPATGTWTAASGMSTIRVYHTATLLPTGKVLVTGGVGTNGTVLNSTTLYDPVSGLWTAGASLPTARQMHTATLLGNGRVLLAGGRNGGGPDQQSLLYNSSTGTWASTGKLNLSNYGHTATLLPNGQVLVAGGSVSLSASSGAALYDPQTGMWKQGLLSGIGNFPTPLYSHTATLLPNGKVLITGGNSGGGANSNARLYGPINVVAAGAEGVPTQQTGTFSDVEGNATVTLSASSGDITQNNFAGTWRWTATGGEGPTTVPITITAADSLGGLTTTAFTFSITNAVPVVAIQGPASAPSKAAVDFTFTATDTSGADQAAGFAWTLDYGDGTAPETVPAGTLSPLVRTHVFANGGIITVKTTARDKDGGVSSFASAVITLPGPHVTSPTRAKLAATSALLGGTIVSDGGSPITGFGVIYSRTSVNANPILGEAGVVRIDGSGTPAGVFTVGAEHLTPTTGYSFKAFAITAAGITYSAASTFTTTVNRVPVLTIDREGFKFGPAEPMITARRDHTATLLANGTVLVVGGKVGSASLSSAELYNTATCRWTATGSLSTGRSHHTATLLPNGRVLVVGGAEANSTPLQSAELYNPESGTWNNVASLNTERLFHHTSTLLADGTVLVVGGYGNNTTLSEVERYYPVSDMWFRENSLPAGRRAHSATLLSNGKVLIAGGVAGSSSLLSSSLLRDPSSGAWTGTGSLSTTRSSITSILLPDGNVLAYGGSDSNTSEVYNPVSGLWTAAGGLPAFRQASPGALLTNGKVLVAGGSGGGLLSSAAVYATANAGWSATGPLSRQRIDHTMTLLPDGRVLVAGGYGSAPVLASVEIYESFEVPAAGREKAPPTRSGTFYDADGNATVTLTASSGTISKNFSEGTWNWVAGADDGPAASQITITAKDDLDSTVSGAFPFALSNTEPDVTIFAPSSAAVGVPVNCLFTAVDPSTADQTAGFTWTLQYGDGTASETVSTASSPMTKFHVFAFPGTYTINATAMDKDGGVSQLAVKPITILNYNALEKWRLSHFGSAANSGDGANLVDADMDGIANLAEFAFGLNPISGLSAELPSPKLLENNLVLSFPQPVGVSGISYGAEVSPSLLPDSWLPVPDSGTGNTHIFRAPMGSNSQLFIRLLVMEP